MYTSLSLQVPKILAAKWLQTENECHFERQKLCLI